MEADILGLDKTKLSLASEIKGREETLGLIQRYSSLENKKEEEAKKVKEPLFCSSC